MQITDVRIRKIAKYEVMKLINLLNILFVIHDIKLIEGSSGLFVAMPSRKGSDGEYRDVAHPINGDMRKRLHEKIIEAYDLACEQLEEA